MSAPGELRVKRSNEAVYEYALISRGKTSEQDHWGEGNLDLLVDSEAVTMDKTHFLDRPDIHTATERCGFDQYIFDATKPWCMFNVMLVEWEGEVAYRLGVGRVHLDAWAQAHPKLKVVKLG